MTATTFDKRSGLAFIVAFGIVSLFADMAYEGMRSISGPWLGLLGASGAIVGTVAGTGELFGYLLRLGSGRLAERTGAYWLIAIAGYAVQMTAIPLMALAHAWWAAALLIVLERSGKALRSPAANTMQSRAGEHIGQGWAFGLHEALDQTGALTGPLIAALVLALHHDYRAAFLWLGVPALLTMLTVLGLRARFPYAGHLPQAAAAADGAHTLPRAFWFYAGASVLVAFGFADFSLIAFHFVHAHVIAEPSVPVFYAVAMGASGVGSLVFGRWFDRRGLSVLIPGFLISACAPPLVFLGSASFALAGTLAWGIALGINDAIMNAGIATMVPAQLRARAYATFSAIFGIAWFAGSALEGWLYDTSITGLVVVASAAELLALLPLMMTLRTSKQTA